MIRFLGDSEILLKAAINRITARIKEKLINSAQEFSEIADEIIQPHYDDLNTPGYIANLHQLHEKAQKGTDQDKSVFVFT